MPTEEEKDEQRAILTLKIDMMRDVLADVKKLKDQIDSRIDNLVADVYMKSKSPMRSFRDYRLTVLTDLQTYLPALKLSQDTRTFEMLIEEYEKQWRGI